ncbi:MAG: GNAT family N-acetyltransferase [Chloroflexia bacterium]
MAAPRHAIVWYDEDNHTGVFEPVRTDPAYQRKGLSRAVLTEGLAALAGVGRADRRVTNGDNVAANPATTPVGFLVVGDNHAWKKAF